MTYDITSVNRNIERRTAMQPHVDVDIGVKSPNDEEARELADELAQAVHEVLEDDDE